MANRLLIMRPPLTRKLWSRVSTSATHKKVRCFRLSGGSTKPKRQQNQWYRYLTGKTPRFNIHRPFNYRIGENYGGWQQTYPQIHLLNVPGIWFACNTRNNFQKAILLTITSDCMCTLSVPHHSLPIWSILRYFAELHTIEICYVLKEAILSMNCSLTLINCHTSNS